MGTAVRVQMLARWVMTPPHTPCGHTEVLVASVVMGWAHRAPLGCLGLMARGHCVTSPPAGLPVLGVWQLQTCSSRASLSFPFLFWLDQPPWDQSTPQHHHHSTPDGSWDHQDHFVHKGLAVLAVFTFCQAFRVSGCCVCTCVCACVRVRVCFRLFLHRMRYLLSARGRR